MNVRLDSQNSGKCTRAAWLPAIVLAVASAARAASDDATGAGVDKDDTRYFMRAGILSASEHAEIIRRLTGYRADVGDCGHVQLGPLTEGEYTREEAWLKLIAPVCSVLVRRDARSGETRLVADMSNCKCSFGFARLGPLESRHVVVTAPALPKLDEYAVSSTFLVDRQRIQQIGAASIPELLRYLSQTAFSRSRGYRASGASFAELRGLGAAYTLVLINGRRAFGTAADLATSAYDISAIPIAAVDHIEIRTDANSVAHGMDAIGGIVNVVLSDRVEPASALRHSTYRGGGAESHASISGGVRGERGRIAVFFDAQRGEKLLGRERDRWNNQDYTRFGGYDYRSPVASPPNFYSLDGQNLPGLAAPFAAAEFDENTGTFDFIAGQRNLTSLRAYQAIVPESSRVTLVAKGVRRMGSAHVSAEWLAIRRENEMQLYPSSVPGYTMSARHPENPFGVPVGVDALLTGLPAQRYQVQTDSQRAVADLEGRLGGWRYNGFIVQVREQAKLRRRNVTDPVAIAQALSTDDSSHALRLYGALGPGADSGRFLADTPVDRFMANATQLQASMSGPLLRLPAGDLKCNVGVEYRRERMDFDTRVHGARRDVASSFAQIDVPLIHSAMNLPAMEAMNLVLGARRDDYSDIGGVTRTQIGLQWRMTQSLRLLASNSESLRPPSLAELNWPRFVVPTVVFDARRAQTAPVVLATGGNPDLKPTWGRSNSIGATFESKNGLRWSAEYWRVKVRGHISALAPLSLLAYEYAAVDRVVRSPITSEDRYAGRPGRLLGLDISQQNLGGATTQGIDLSIRRALDTRFGTFTPQLSMTYTDEFQHNDLPIAPMEDRVGVASELGTIPAQRAVVSLGFERGQWSAAIHARLISSYRDRSAFSGEPMQRRVPGGAIWDLNVSRYIGNLQVKLGVFNLADREPPFANVGGSLGYDTSQGDLAGRQIYGQLNAEFP